MPCRSHRARQSREKPVRRHEIAALALDRLDENARHLARRHVVDEQRFLDVLEHRLSLVRTREQRPVIIGIRNMGDSRMVGKNPFCWVYLLEVKESEPWCARESRRESRGSAPGPSHNVRA